MESAKKIRITYLDTARGIGVILMIVGHLLGALQGTDNKSWFAPVCRIIVSFHMPLFFVLAGMVMQVTNEIKKDWKIFVGRKIRTLLVPYVVFSCSYLLIYLIMHLKNPMVTDRATLYKQLLYVVSFRGISVLWFLPALFLAEILFNALVRGLGISKTTIVLIVLGILILWTAPMIPWSKWESMGYGMIFLGALVLTVMRGMLATVFLALGWHFYTGLNFYAKCKGENSGCIRAAIGFVVGFFFVVACGILSFQNIVVDLNYMIFGNIILYMICAVGASCGVILMCRFGYPSKLLRFLGENSLVIMATHMDFRVLKIAIDLGYIVSSRIARAKEWIFFGTIGIVILALEVAFILLFRYLFFWVLGKKNPWKGRDSR